jgi:hypothetical protein
VSEEETAVLNLMEPEGPKMGLILDIDDHDDK